METKCCRCGVEQSATQAIELEQERLQEEKNLGIPVPIIGIVCTSCQDTLSVML